MVSALDNFSAFNHQNLIGRPNRGQAMGDHKSGAPLTKGRECTLDHGFAFAIETRSGFVENQDARIGQNRTGNRNALPLATR